MSHEDGTFKAVTVDSHKAIYCTSLLIISLILLGIVAALLCSKCKKKLQRRNTAVAASPAELPENEMVSPSFLYSKQSSGMIQCSACRSTIIDGEMVQEWPICKHLFHANCITTRIQSNSTCPLCQNNIHPPDEKIRASSSDQPA